MNEVPFPKVSSCPIILSFCCVLRPLNCWGQESERHYDYLLSQLPSVWFSADTQGSSSISMNIRLPLLKREKVLLWKIHRKMQFVGTTSLAPKTIQRTNVKKPAAQSTWGWGEGSLDLGSYRRGGVFTWAGIVFVYTHQLCLYHVSSCKIHCLYFSQHKEFLKAWLKSIVIKICKPQLFHLSLWLNSS